MDRTDELSFETADADTRPRTGRGMVVAKLSGVVVDGVRETIKAGVTRIWKNHEWLRRPDVAALFGLTRDGQPDWYLPPIRSHGEEPWRL